MIDDKVRDTLRLWLPPVLAHRLEGLSPQFGKTVFKDLAYLLQTVYGVPLGYRFTLFVNGPCDERVFTDLDLAKMRGLVQVDYVESEREFRITPGPRAEDTTSENEVFADYQDELKHLVETFGRFGAKALDLRASTIHIWNMMQRADVDADREIVENVHALKPHIDESEIKKAVEELKCNGTIRIVLKSSV